MKIVMKIENENSQKRTDWSKKGFNMNRYSDLDEEETTFILYDEARGEKKIADFLLCLKNTSAVGIIERLHVYDKTINKEEILQNLLDYLYILESPYFKILGLRIDIRESGLNDDDLQCAGFFTNNAFTFYHLHPHFEEALNLGTNDEEIKAEFRKRYNGYCTVRENYKKKMYQQLEDAKRGLEYYELEGNQEMAAYKRQDIEKYEKILSANETEGLKR